MGLMCEVLQVSNGILGTFEKSVCNNFSLWEAVHALNIFQVKFPIVYLTSQ